MNLILKFHILMNMNHLDKLLDYIQEADFFIFFIFELVETKSIKQAKFMAKRIYRVCYHVMEGMPIL